MAEWRETRTKECACPNCGAVVNAATGVDDPKPGDLTICIRCHGVSAFGLDLTLRKMTPSEYARLTEAERAQIEYARRTLALVEAAGSPGGVAHA